MTVSPSTVHILVDDSAAVGSTPPAAWSASSTEK
jgi:hypothetical protein